MERISSNDPIAHDQGILFMLDVMSCDLNRDLLTKRVTFENWCFTMEFNAAMKNNEMLSFAGKWMELENIILSEVSLAQKIKNRMFSLICGH
jgi:hypothetical protein